MRKTPTAIGIALVAALAAGCGASSQQSDGGSAVLVGAGSTLVAPLVARWTGDYSKKNDVTITYSGIGSGGGIAQATAKTVDFGASDAPLQPDQKDAAPDLVQIPWALAATVVAVNIPGVAEHPKLTGKVLADIFSGAITNWDDPAIAALNPGITFPKQRIAVVHRSDSSGDTFVFTSYLARVSAGWKADIGAGTEVAWPTGTGAKGNAGVAAALDQTPGAITYIGVAHVKSAGLNYALLRNRAGAYPEPSTAAIAAAAAAADGTELVDSPQGYPLSTFTYVLVQRDSSKLAALKAFLRYAVTDGQAFAEEVAFAPLPRKVREKALGMIEGL